MLKKDYLDYVMSLLSPLEGASSKSMFGGYGIFQDGKMFALISGTSLYFKVDDASRAAYEQAGSQQFKPMPYYEVPPDILEDIEKLLEWANASISAAQSAPVKKKKK